MADINFDCPGCGQNLDAPVEMAGEVITCPACQGEIVVPGGIMEMPAKPIPVQKPAGPANLAEKKPDADKGNTVRIDLPKEFVEQPEFKRQFTIKRIKH